MFQWAPANVRLFGLFLSYTTVGIFLFFSFFIGSPKIAYLIDKLKLKLRISQYSFLLVLVIFAFCIRLPFVQFNPVSDDEPYYISSSLLYIEGFGEGFGSEKFVANYEHPPLVKYLMGGYLKTLFPSINIEYSREITNNELLIHGRLFNVFLGSLTLIPLYFLAEKIRKNLGFFSVFFLALNPSHARMSGLAYLDITMIFFGVCSILFVIRFLEESNLRNIIFSGTVTGFLLSTKSIQPLLFVIPIIPLILIHWKKIPGYILSLGISFGVLLALWTPLLWNFGVYRIIDFLNWVFSHWTVQVTSMIGPSLSYVALWNLSVPELILIIICCFFVFSIIVIDFKEKRGNYKSLVTILAILIPLFLLQIERRGAVYYWTSLTPFFSIILAETLYVIQKRFN